MRQDRLNKNLVDACYLGDLHSAKRALLKGADPNAASPTPLICLAASDNRLEITELLVSAGTDLGTVDCENNTALHLAARFGNRAIAKILIKAGAKLNALNCYGATPLTVAAMASKERVVQLLIDKGAIVDVGDNNNMAPLYHAARASNTNIIRFLINAGASMAGYPGAGIGQLSYALTYRHYYAAYNLIDSDDDRQKFYDDFENEIIQENYDIIKQFGENFPDELRLRAIIASEGRAADFIKNAI